MRKQRQPRKLESIVAESYINDANKGEKKFGLSQMGSERIFCLISITREKEKDFLLFREMMNRANALFNDPPSVLTPSTR